ncbi:hypothetical protein AB1Y20_011481 [Prymnesium parvum]|uniref:CDP-diacylglycerol--inositol 3-phosphatidyltransferase n=1 Tax=Prymnesium parvum TaxID=97485 RepID=A0AB34IJX2_PRYPA|mmetsp:Transcript_2800/g.5889  ORF Transcript_2800/g.5889 Transcript_2800/m.5889 type:complete len:223 (-) Transcript_2800:398-1066(-)
MNGTMRPSFFLLDPKRIPFWLYPPNLIGYLRVASLLVALLEPNPGSSLAVRSLCLSLALDFIDGPLARKLGMCTQFGDLLDHVADHITMFWLVYITTDSQLNAALNGLHCAVALGYMAVTGHYFKHSAAGNVVTRAIEANNYFNMPSLLWNANSWLIPLVKLSYAVEHGLPRTASTELVDVCDFLGCAVSTAYTIAVLWPSRTQGKAASSTFARGEEKSRAD